jgi:hypothetical protein
LSKASKESKERQNEKTVEIDLDIRVVECECGCGVVLFNHCGKACAASFRADKGGSMIIQYTNSVPCVSAAKKLSKLKKENYEKSVDNSVDLFGMFRLPGRVPYWTPV